MARALYPGSFDPIHLGHLTVVGQASRAFDEVVIAVLGNPAKPSGLFSISRRVELVSAATAHFGNVRCVAFEGLTVDLARTEDVDFLVRAAHKETAIERSMAAVNEGMSGIQTFFATPDAATWTISSSAVRTLVENGEIDAAAQLVPDPVQGAIRSLAAGAPVTRNIDA